MLYRKPGVLHSLEKKISQEMFFLGISTIYECYMEQTNRKKFYHTSQLFLNQGKQTGAS